MNQIRILFFATLREKAGTRSIEMEISPGATIQMVKSILIGKNPNLNDYLKTCLTSINHDYQMDDAEIPNGAEVAFFPPVSGGRR